MAKRQTARETRAQESREAEIIHEEYDDDWEEPGLLDTTHIPPRPGYVQRWVRTQVQGNDDGNNVARKLNQGWRPRMADTVPKGSYVATIEHTRYGNVVGLEGMILMERPAARHEAQARRNRNAAKDQLRAADENQYRENSNLAYNHRPERRSRTTTGRPVRVADDE